MTLKEEVTAILSKTPSEWTKEDWLKIDEGNRKLGRDVVRSIRDEVSPD